MKPILFSIGGYPILSYSVMMALALFLGIYFAARECENRRLPLTPAIGLLIFAIGYLGAKTYWVIQYEGIAALGHALYFWRPGLVFYGGVIGGLAAYLACLRIKRISVTDGLDIAAPYAALAEALGRIGCFLNGCCWGKVCDLPWAVTFPQLTYPHESQISLGLIAPSALRTLPVHPTQLYMALGLIALFVLVKRSLDWPAFAGVTIVLYCILQGSLRFVVDFFRGDTPPVVLQFTAGQVTSAFLILSGVVLGAALYRARRPRWES